MWIFLGAIAVVALLGAVRTCVHPSAANRCRWYWLFRVYAADRGADYYPDQNQSRVYSKNEVFRSGMIAIVAVYGIDGWQKPCSVRICLKFRAYWVNGERVSVGLCHCSAAGFQV